MLTNGIISFEQLGPVIIAGWSESLLFAYGVADNLRIKVVVFVYLFVCF